MKAIGSGGDRKYLSTIGAWALAFGCSVGWGAFVMPGTTFLPVAGPAGTAIGIALGALVMFIVARNYHYLINRYPDGGGAYTYTRKCFGYDHGFLSAWFLILTYIAIIWANATALPLIARTLFGSTFQFGFDYEIAGFHVYFGEILLAVTALFIGAFACMRRRVASGTQIVLAILLFAGVVVCFIAAAAKGGASLKPAFYPDKSAAGGTFTIFALAPWAFVGFESISHSAGEAKFSLKRSFKVMIVALVTAAIAYIFLSLMAVTALPEGVSDWTEYVGGLGNFSGISSQPTFFAAKTALGTYGSVILGVAALSAIFTGIIGNYIALSRLITTLSDDGVLAGRIGKLD
ncbi:MAG: APC family permease, partial [Clostridia bacterium]|nr:APC family permease [Clostridia bacterium]